MTTVQATARVGNARNNYRTQPGAPETGVATNTTPTRTGVQSTEERLAALRAAREKRNAATGTTTSGGGGGGITTPSTDVTARLAARRLADAQSPPPYGGGIPRSRGEDVYHPPKKGIDLSHVDLGAGKGDHQSLSPSRNYVEGDDERAHHLEAQAITDLLEAAEPNEKKKFTYLKAGGQSDWTLYEVAHRILNNAKRPLHTAEIAEEAIRLGYMESGGTGNLHPHKRIYGAISKHLHHRGKQWFQRVAPATFTVRASGQKRKFDEISGDLSPENKFMKEQNTQMEDLEELEKTISSRLGDKSFDEDEVEVEDDDMFYDWEEEEEEGSSCSETTKPPSQTKSLSKKGNPEKPLVHETKQGGTPTTTTSSEIKSQKTTSETKSQKTTSETKSQKTSETKSQKTTSETKPQKTLGELFPTWNETWPSKEKILVEVPEHLRPLTLFLSGVPRTLNEFSTSTQIVNEIRRKFQVPLLTISRLSVVDEIWQVSFVSEENVREMDGKEIVVVHRKGSYTIRFVNILG